VGVLHDKLLTEYDISRELTVLRQGNTSARKAYLTFTCGGDVENVGQAMDVCNEACVPSQIKDCRSVVSFLLSWTMTLGCGHFELMYEFT
jgi:hypothetical protein